MLTVLLVLPRPIHALLATATCFLAAAVVPLNEPLRLVAAPAIQRSDNSEAASSPLFYEVGSSTTVYVNLIEGRLHFYTNGLPEAQASIVGAPADRNTQRWLGALPFLLRPDSGNALLVGFGGGLAIEGVPSDVGQIDVVELEPEVIAANRAVGALRGNDPSRDDRVTIYINDARNALVLSDARYDAIISQPSHPWTPGAANLYTREFFALARSHLTEDGVFVQWINSTFITEDLLRSLCATLLAEFDHVRLYRPDPTELYFVASNRAFADEQSLAREADRLAHFAAIGLPAWEDLLVALALDERGVEQLAQDARPNGDDHNLMAFRSRSQADGLDAAALDAILLPLDPLTEILTRDGTAINIGYLATRLVATGFQRRALALAQSVDEPGAREFIHAIGLRYYGQMEQADSALAHTIAADPQNQQALYAYVTPYLGTLASGQAPVGVAEAAGRLSGSAAAVLAGWRLGQQGQWASLQELDDELAGAGQSDLWRPQAVKLRLDWRVQISAATGNPEVARDALTIADSLLPVYQSADILALRAAAAHLSGDTLSFAESVRALSIHAREKLARARAGEYDISPGEARLLMRRLQGMTSELRVVRPNSAERIGPVVRHSELTVRLLAQYSQTNGASRPQ